MRIIDRYVLRQFICTFLVCYLSMTGLFIVFDAFTHMEEFLRCGREQGSVLGLLTSYYSYRSVLFFDQMVGLLSLIAAMFTISCLQRHNEMTALMSAGISRLRVAVPVIAMAVVIAFLAAGSREFLIPRFRDQLSRRPQDLIGDVGRSLQPRYDNRTDVRIGGEMTFVENMRISKPLFLMPRSLDNYGGQFSAKRAFYQPPIAERPGGYLLDEMIKPSDLQEKPSLRLDGKPVTITPLDAPGWLEPDQCFVVSDVTFEQLTGGHAWREYSSTKTLIEGLRNPSLASGADVRVAIHSRMTKPFLDVTLLFLGLPLVLTRQSRNVFVALGLCSLMVSVFSLSVIAFEHLGKIYSISPSLAAWAPLIIFVPAAVAMADSMRR